MKKTRYINYVLAFLLGTATTFTASGAVQANDHSASFLTISTEQFLPDHATMDESATDKAKSPAPPPDETEATENEEHANALDIADTDAETITEPPSIVVTLPAQKKEEKTTGADLLAACRDKMFTDRGTGYCINKKHDQEQHELQKTDQIAYIALRHNENPAAFRKKRRNLATENLAHRLKMETECHNRKKSTDGSFNKEMADVTCRIDHMEKYREQLSTRYLDYYDDKNDITETAE